MLLAERFLPGAGWLELLALGGYAAWVANRLSQVRLISRTRRFVWGLFSLVFFGQLAAGLLGFERFLMSGALHLPVPAMIAAGPVFRGGGWFMPILLMVTVLLVGPAWCSHLCYIGALDSAMAHRQPGKHQQRLPRHSHWLRALALVLVVGSAVVLRGLGAETWVAAALGLAFGLVGVGVMLYASRRRGLMVHCLTFCPIGLLTVLAGKLAPFRLRIASSCDDCNACTYACRYNALHVEDVQRRRAGLSCTLCGDCLSYCRHRSLQYRFLGLSPDTARWLFVVLVSALHATFMGVARI